MPGRSNNVAYNTTDFKGHSLTLLQLMNLKFSYLYRDYSNYKKFNEIVFDNPSNKSLHEIRDVIEEHLLDGEWFYASEWKVPDLHFDSWDSENDHFLHEFHSIEETTEKSTAFNSIDDFLILIKNAKTEF